MNDRSRFAPLFVTFVVLLAASLMSQGCGGHDETAATAAAPPPTVDVTLAEAQLQPLDSAAPLTGSVRARREVSPGSKILGRVDQILVREGERVGREGLLARLESRDLEASLAQAEAAVTMAQAQLENATAQHERMEALAGRGSATPKNLEDATAAHRVAQAGLAQAEANLEAARVALGYSEIRSPIAGWVVERRIEAGDMASPGTVMFVVQDLSRVEIEVQVPEAQVVEIEEGQSAQVTVLGRQSEAEVARVHPSGDPASRTFTVKLDLENPDGLLRSGMFARVSFSGAVREGISVERSAVVGRGQLDGLFVADDDGLLRLRWVKTGHGDAERVEVLSGLEAGERYVTAPPPGLIDGTPHREVPTGGGGAS